MNGVPKIGAPGFLPKNRLAESLYNGIDGLSEMVKLIYTILRYAEFDVEGAFSELRSRYEDTATQLDTWITKVDSVIEAGLPSEEERTGVVTLERYGDTYNNAVVVLSLVNLLALAMEGQSGFPIDPAAEAYIQQWAPSFKERVTTTLAPLLAGSEGFQDKLFEGLQERFPSLEYNARPAIESNLGLIYELREGLTTGELDGDPWYSSLLDRILGRDEAPHLSMWQYIWLKLQPVIRSVVEAQARFWFALGYRVLDAAWEDWDADSEVEV